MTLEQLKSEEKELLSKLSENRIEQREIDTKMFIKSIGCGIGDKISFKDGIEIATGVIDYFEYSGTHVSWAMAKMFKQDGKLGERIKRVYDVKSIVKID